MLQSSRLWMSSSAGTLLLRSRCLGKIACVGVESCDKTKNCYCMQQLLDLRQVMTAELRDRRGCSASLLLAASNRLWRLPGNYVSDKSAAVQHIQ